MLKLVSPWLRQHQSAGLGCTRDGCWCRDVWVYLFPIWQEKVDDHNLGLYMGIQLRNNIPGPLCGCPIGWMSDGSAFTTAMHVGISDGGCAFLLLPNTALSYYLP